MSRQSKKIRGLRLSLETLQAENAELKERNAILERDQQSFEQKAQRKYLERYRSASKRRDQVWAILFSMQEATAGIAATALSAYGQQRIEALQHWSSELAKRANLLKTELAKSGTTIEKDYAPVVLSISALLDLVAQAIQGTGNTTLLDAVITDNKALKELAKSWVENKPGVPIGKTQVIADLVASLGWDDPNHNRPDILRRALEQLRQIEDPSDSEYDAMVALEDKLTDDAQKAIKYVSTIVARRKLDPKMPKLADQNVLIPD